MVSRFCRSWWVALGVRILSFRFFGVHRSDGFGASGCLGGSFILCVPLAWGDRLSTPKSNGFIIGDRGYFGGKGTAHCPLPHMLEMAILLDSGNFGGGRIGTSPFLLTLPVCTSEGEGQAFLPHINGGYLGGGGTGPPLHNNDEYFGGGGTGPPPHIDGKFLKCTVVAQLGRSDDTMICVKGTHAHGCRSEPLGTFCDTMRRMCVVNDWAVDGWDAFGDTIRQNRQHRSRDAPAIPGSVGGTRFSHGCKTIPLGDALRYHARDVQVDHG